MSTLRERIEALAKEWEEQPDRLTVWGTSAAALRSALESETREAALCRCGHGEKAHSPDGWCEFDDCLCTYFRPPPPANTENDR